MKASICSLLLFLMGLLGGCCTVQPYQRSYILAEEKKIKHEIEATSGLALEPSMVSNSEALPSVSPTMPLKE